MDEMDAMNWMDRALKIAIGAFVIGNR